MSDCVNDQRVQIGYNPVTKDYFIPLLHNCKITSLQCLFYCPWCSKKLPTGLRFEVLEKEYGLDDPDSKEQKLLIPKEFETDEWWKKRGL